MRLPDFLFPQLFAQLLFSLTAEVGAGQEAPLPTLSKQTRFPLNFMRLGKLEAVLEKRKKKFRNFLHIRGKDVARIASGKLSLEARYGTHSVGL